MSANQTHIRQERRHAGQAGIALPVVMIFVVVMTLIGVAVIRNVTLEEKMAGNQHSQQIALQAAEEALRDCENYIQDTAIAAADRFYKDQNRTDLGPNVVVPAWDSAKWSDANYRRNVTLKTGSKSAGAVCAIELFRVPCKPMELTGAIDWCDAYRVTARGYGTADSSRAVVQSFISLP